MNEDLIFESKVSSTGHPRWPALIVVVPAAIRDLMNVKAGDVLKLKLLSKSNGVTYPKLNGFPDNVQYERMKKCLDKYTNKLNLSIKLKLRTISNAIYLYNVLSERQKNHTQVRSIVAASLYVTSIQEDNRITQVKTAELFELTEVTVRNKYKIGWNSDLEKKYPITEIATKPANEVK